MVKSHLTTSDKFTSSEKCDFYFVFIFYISLSSFLKFEKAEFKEEKTRWNEVIHS